MPEQDSLVNFYSKISREAFLTQNLFSLRFNLNSVPNDVADALNDIQLAAQGVSVPGITQNTAEVSYRGYKFNVPTNTTYSGELTLTVRSDAAHKIRGGILAWVNSISGLNIIDNPLAGAGNKLIGDNTLDIDLLDPGNMSPITTYRLYGIIPGGVGDITMTNDAAEIATFDLTLKYQFFIVENSPEHLPSGIIPDEVLTKGRSIVDGAFKLAKIITSF